MTERARWQATLEELTTILPPPRKPYRSEISWVEAEAAVGVRLPDDFKAFIDMYGPGEVNLLINLMIFQHPAASEAVDYVLKKPIAMRENFPSEYELAIFPEPGGIFPFATTSNGEELYWATDPIDSPNDWRILLHEGRGAELMWFDGRFVDLLLAALTGQGDVAGFFPDDFASMPLEFVPWQPK